MTYDQIGNVIYVQLYVEDVHLCLSPCFLLLLSSGVREKLKEVVWRSGKIEQNKMLFKTIASYSFHTNKNKNSVVPFK